MQRIVASVVVGLVGITTGGTLASAIAHAVGGDPLVPAVAGCVAGALGGFALAGRVARALPDELTGWLGRRRILAVLWLIASVLALANTARITIFMADARQVWASAFPPMPESAEHQCAAAYVHAGELAASGHANLWNGHDYLGPRDGVTPETEVVGMAPFMTNPYEYPPVLAAVARCAVAATNDYALIRVLWFGLSAFAFWTTFLALALWVRGRAGATALLLVPPLALAMPLIFCLQWGQAHVVVVAASVASMLLFDRGHTKSGAALLALAIATKIFPGLLLVHLAVRRRWRDLTTTCIALLLVIAASALVLGVATWTTYLQEQLPAMASGEAFKYIEDNPDNYAPYGIAFKLAAFGVDAGRTLASLLAWLWGLAALVLTILASRASRDRAHEAILWLGIICVATLRSPFAPLYTGIGSLWLLAIAYGAAPRTRWFATAVTIAWILLQGFPPIGSPVTSALLSLPAQVVTIAIAIAAVWPRRR